MSWHCDNCESVNSDTERRCHVCGAIRETELGFEPWDEQPIERPPSGTDFDKRHISEIRKKPNRTGEILIIILSSIITLAFFWVFFFPSALKPQSESDFVAEYTSMPNYEDVLAYPIFYKNRKVKLNLSVGQVMGAGLYRCYDDAFGDQWYSGYEYYVIDRRGASADAFKTFDAFTAYCVIVGTERLARTLTGEIVTLVKLELEYIDSAPIATPTPKPTPEPTPEPWSAETLEINGIEVTGFAVDLSNYNWEEVGEWSESKQAITKNTWSYPFLLKGAIENCFGIRIRRFSAEATTGDPFSVSFKGVVRLRDGKWSSGDTNNAFEYQEGTEVDVYILFQQPTSFSAVDIVPTKAQKRECGWNPSFYSPVLYFATIEDATRYIDSIS
ncbi:hypothetical protein SDC9_70783 [bioreactor metagenome]|uniref:RanBP2-type domain-containing protein n=1 Tax=bioreactor metagenome TaxID=1076179 RepID=A0A644Y6T9_9ZZZZ